LAAVLRNVDQLVTPIIDELKCRSLAAADAAVVTRSNLFVVVVVCFSLLFLWGGSFKMEVMP